MTKAESGSGKDNEKKKARRAEAQVGTWVIPMSGTGTAGSTCEGSAHQPARLRVSRSDVASRPKAKRVRPSPLTLRVSDQQRAAIKAKAKAAGLSVNRYLLLLACGSELAPVKPTVEDRVERAGALRAYRGTGTLLNQIARHLNSGRIVGAFDIAALLERHDKNAKEVLTAFIKGMPYE